MRRMYDEPDLSIGLEEFDSQKEALKALLAETDDKEVTSVDVSKIKSIIESMPDDKRVQLLDYIRGANEETILQMAIKRNFFDLVKAIFEVLTNEQAMELMKKRGKYKKCVFTYSMSSTAEIRKFLLDAFTEEQLLELFRVNDTYNRNMVHQSIFDFKPESFIDFSKRFTNENWMILLKEKDFPSHTAAHSAASMSKFEMNKYLMSTVSTKQWGELQRLKDREGRIPIFHAYGYYNKKEAKKLIDLIPPEERYAVLSEPESRGLLVMYINDEMCEYAMPRLTPEERIKIMHHKNNDGQNLFHFSIRKGYRGMSMCVLNIFPKDVLLEIMRIEDSEGTNGLHYACSAMATDEIFNRVIEIIPMEEKFDWLSKRIDMGWTPLSFATCHERPVLPRILEGLTPEQVLALTKIKCEYGISLMMHIAHARYFFHMKALLDHLPKESIQGLLLERNRTGMNSVHLACDLNKQGTLQAMLAHQSAEQIYELMDAYDDKGYTPLHHAVLRLMPISITYLWSRIATVELKDVLINRRDKKDRRTPLDEAGMQRSAACIITLIEPFGPHRRLELLLSAMKFMRDKFPLPPLTGTAWRPMEVFPDYDPDNPSTEKWLVDKVKEQKKNIKDDLEKIADYKRKVVELNKKCEEDSIVKRRIELDKEQDELLELGQRLEVERLDKQGVDVMHIIRIKDQVNKLVAKIKAAGLVPPPEDYLRILRD